jgi:hypothetical protein
MSVDFLTVLWYIIVELSPIVFEKVLISYLKSKIWKPSKNKANYVEKHQVDAD